MFENLTAREKKLAMIVGALAPILLIGLSLFWFMDKYQKNSVDLSNLESDIGTEELKETMGMMASKRQDFYREVSLPSGQNEARSKYLAWLTELIKDDIQMEYSGIKPASGGKISHNGQLIGRKTTFTTRPIATYPQLVQFLNEFYSADHLHRINSLTILPESKKERNKKVLTGRLKLTMEIEVLALEEADAKFEFPRHAKTLEKDLAAYQTSILGRNIFGLANNPPSFEKPPGGSHLPNESISLTLRAKDLDKDNLLQFQILESECDITGWSLGDQPTVPEKRSIRLKIPGQKIGSYKMKARVFDSGLPSKSDEISFTVVVKAKPDPPPRKIPKKMTLAKVTFIVGHLLEADEKWAMLVHDKKSNEVSKMRVGDKMELDEAEWMLESMDKSSITFRVGNELRKFGTSGSLDRPLETKVIEEIKGADVKEPSDEKADT